MGIFTKAPVYSQKSMVYNKASKSPVMKKILADKDIAKALDETREREEFYGKLKQKEAGGVTKDELREILGELRSGRGKYISKNEAQQIGKKFFSSASNRYKYSSTWDCGLAASKNDSSKINPAVDRPQPARSTNPSANFAPRFNNSLRTGNQIVAGGNRPQVGGFNRSSVASSPKSGSLPSSSRPSFSPVLKSTLFKK